MHCTIEHYYKFPSHNNLGDKLTIKEGWDKVRCDDNCTPFSIPNNVIDYNKMAITEYKDESKDIADLVDHKGHTTILSVGCGRGFLEYNIKTSSPELKVIATDFNEQSIERLKNVLFICDDVEVFDLLEDRFYYFEGLIYLLFRVDTELDNDTWLNIFYKMHEAGVKYILVVATEFVSINSLIKETVKKLLKNVLHYSFSGYIRTKESFENLWADYYIIDKPVKIGNFCGYYLRINNEKKGSQ